ncbi:MAG: glycosyltransferase family 1 protein [Pedobacter sp.]|nr:MAG: glycosyltransferase family 1 protein [Pedobacter sp.]
MPKVLFDHQTFSLQRYGGISRYFANVYNAMQNGFGVEADISILNSNNYYIRDYDGLLSNSLGKWIFSEEKRGYKWNKQYSKYRISKNDFDILHPTYYHPYFLKKLKKPYVVTVHDMIHEIMPEYFSSGDILPTHKRLCIQNAAHIIAISHTTKKDLIEVLNVPHDRISVIHHGYMENNDEVIQRGETNNGRYMLFVGERTAYKNFSKFAFALSLICSKEKDIKLICAGGGPLQNAEQELLNRLNLTDKVIQITASEQELNLLYKNAIAFVFPSLYEGFGLPILEAFKNNCPIIASDTACFREIAEDACAYFDPSNSFDIAEKMELIISNTTLRNELILKGSKQLLKFSMAKCITKTIDVYKSLK